MTKKKRNSRISVNLNKAAVICLQKLDYLDDKNSSVGNKSLSGFINKLILEFVDLNNPDWKRYIEEKLLVSQLYDLSIKRDKFEDEMKFIGSQITAIREMKNIGDGMNGDKKHIF